jgi:chromosome segregation ATPase
MHSLIDDLDQETEGINMTERVRQSMSNSVANFQCSTVFKQIERYVTATKDFRNDIDSIKKKVSKMEKELENIPSSTLFEGSDRIVSLRVKLSEELADFHNVERELSCESDNLLAVETETQNLTEKLSMIATHKLNAAVEFGEAISQLNELTGKLNERRLALSNQLSVNSAKESSRNKELQDYQHEFNQLNNSKQSLAQQLMKALSKNQELQHVFNDNENQFCKDKEAFVTMGTEVTRLQHEVESFSQLCSRSRTALWEEEQKLRVLKAQIQGSSQCSFGEKLTSLREEVALIHSSQAVVSTKINDIKRQVLRIDLV